MKTRFLIALAAAVVIALGAVALAGAVSGAAFTTFNAHVDGAGKDVCKNSAINCNIYGAKEYVWLNGGPTANGLGPDGQYFFAVLAPGGQPDPNDGGAKNLSDNYDCWKNRQFTVTNGEVSAYSGFKCSGYPFQDKHWLDSGKSGPKPNWLPPLIRLYPYADTTNPGGVYIMAICYVGSDGSQYPVEPRDCKYDAFKVKKGQLPYSFMLSGIKFQDTYADAVKDDSDTDPGLSGWTITIKGTGPDGQPIDASVVTGDGGYWEWFSKNYSFSGGTQPVEVNLEICEVVQEGWIQSYPTPSCYTLKFTPVPGTFDSFEDRDFGNWQPVSVTACKEQELDDASHVAVAGWSVSLSIDDEVVDTQLTGADGCYTWTEFPAGTPLKPGVVYDVEEEMKNGWMSVDDITHFDFDTAKSNDAFSHTFVNAVLQGCTPGFWQGGNDFETAGGKWLWNDKEDPDWVASGGEGYNPYIWGTLFNDFFAPYSGLGGFDMMSLIGTGGGPDDFQKAARDLVAAYLNSSWGMNYPYSTAELKAMWADAVSSGDFMALHLELDAANNAFGRTDGGPACPISASIP